VFFYIVFGQHLFMSLGSLILLFVAAIWIF
jgi:hypothetical protein